VHPICVCVREGRGAALIFDECLGVIDFCPSSNIAVVYVTEAELVASSAYRRRLVRLRKVIAVSCDEIDHSLILVLSAYSVD